MLDPMCKFFPPSLSHRRNSHGELDVWKNNESKGIKHSALISFVCISFVVVVVY